jgi:hypothetical protein
MLDIVGREHARAWVSLLTVVKSLLAVAVLYYFIQSAPGQVLPIMTWTVFSVFTGVIGGMMGLLAVWCGYTISHCHSRFAVAGSHH